MIWIIWRVCVFRERLQNGFRDMGVCFAMVRRLLFEGLGYLFTAPSGTGKSTHIRLWRQFLGEAGHIVNGDKPFLSVEEGKVFVWGSPWAGKENWQKNRKAPLHGICLLKQGQKNKICRLQPWKVCRDRFRRSTCRRTGKWREGHWNFWILCCGRFRYIGWNVIFRLRRCRPVSRR